MIDVKPATPLDFWAALENAKDFYESEKDSISGFGASIERYPSYTLRNSRGDIGLVVVAVPIWSGVLSLWAVTTNDIYTEPLGFARSTRRLLDVVANDLKIHRAEMYVRADNMESRKFAMFLGMHPEGILRKYGPDKSDYIMFGRTW